LSRKEILREEIVRIARQMDIEARSGAVDPDETIARAERSLRALHPEDAQSADE
jgi:hypothetical protein